MKNIMLLYSFFQWHFQQPVLWDPQPSKLVEHMKIPFRVSSLHLTPLEIAKAIVSTLSATVSFAIIWQPKILPSGAAYNLDINWFTSWIISGLS